MASGITTAGITGATAAPGPQQSLVEPRQEGGEWFVAHERGELMGRDSVVVGAYHAVDEAHGEGQSGRFGDHTHELLGDRAFGRGLAGP